MGGDRKKRWRMLPLIQIEIAQAGRGEKEKCCRGFKSDNKQREHRNTTDAVWVWVCVCVWQKRKRVRYCVLQFLSFPQCGPVC